MSISTPTHAAGISSINTNEDDMAGYLAFFASMKADTLLDSARMVELQPLHPYQKSEPLEFIIGSYSDKFIDLSSIRLCGFMQIRKYDATGKIVDIVAADDDVSFVSLAPLASFKQISVTVQDTEVCDLSTHTYPFRCNMDIRCSFSPGVKKQIYASAFYTDETAGTEQAVTETEGSAYSERKKLLDNVKKKPFVTDLHVEMFNTQRLLVWFSIEWGEWKEAYGLKRYCV